ncbi:MAG: ATP-binding protein [Novosphingobium sp.]|nr:ATP-binding protein [Novosphingobium sp.]
MLRVLPYLVSDCWRLVAAAMLALALLVLGDPVMAQGQLPDPAETGQAEDKAATDAAVEAAQAALDETQSQLDEARKRAEEARNALQALYAREQTRLVASRTAQVGARSMLTAMQAEQDSVSDSALALRERAKRFREETTPGDADANALYDDLVDRLKEIRRELRKALDRSEMLGSDGIDPPLLDADLPPDTEETAALARDRAALVDEAASLRSAYTAQLWDMREVLRDKMIELNNERLALIPYLDDGKQARILGFGEQGVAQVQREISQIVLATRYQVQGWRRFVQEASVHFLKPKPAFVLNLLWLILLVAAFRWWRSAGGRLLLNWQVSLEARRPKTVMSVLELQAVRLLRDIRRPLDWLIFVLVLRSLWPSELDFPGLHFVWIIVLWFLVMAVALKVIDEMAHTGVGEDPRAQLRWRSLRLVGGTLLVVGLVLNLASASVGKGAIYTWVLDLCWLVVPAIALILANWWRERIVSLAGSEGEGSAILGWVARDPGGLTGQVGRLLGGAILLLKGLWSVIVRRARQLALVQEILDQRARAAAARQVEEDKASGRYRRLPREVLDTLDPAESPKAFRTTVGRSGNQALYDVPAGTTALLVGERGLGKSAMLHELVTLAGERGRTIELQVGAGRLEGLFADLATALGHEFEELTAENLAARLADEDGISLIAIDDIQRLVVPAIGGLSDLDTLISMARLSGHRIAWVFTMGSPAWSYVARARFERILFDKVVRLPRWSAAELRKLIERRTKRSGIDPDFSQMIDEGVFRFEGDLTSDERKRMGYFDRLTEYVNGNPAIALGYWRNSLFLDTFNDRVEVRTLATPKVEMLNALPLPAMFVVRAILQMDVADIASIARSTDLSSVIVSDSLRSLQQIGVIGEEAGGWRIRLHWFIEVCRFLERQNLMLKET